MSFAPVIIRLPSGCHRVSLPPPRVSDLMEYVARDVRRCAAGITASMRESDDAATRRHDELVRAGNANELRPGLRVGRFGGHPRATTTPSRARLRRHLPPGSAHH